MRRKIFRAGVLRSFIVALVLALCSALVGSNSAFALSVDDYFSYSPNVELSKTVVQRSEPFEATAIVKATCTKDLPWPYSEATKAQITGRVIARHQGDGTEVTLISEYIVTIEPVPQKAGDYTQTSQYLTLQFPEWSPYGTYSIVAELIEAKVEVLIWIDVTGYLPSSQTVGSVTVETGAFVGPQPGGGGGGGGGGGFVVVVPPTPPPPPPLPPGAIDLSGFVSADGIFTMPIVIESVDGKCWLTVDRGTTGLSGEGAPLATIAMIEAEDPLVPPEDFDIIGFAYTFGPDGTTFDPLITITITYDESLIPLGILEEELVIAMWGEATGEWAVLDGCIVNPETNTVTAPISSFSTFTILTPIPEAVFSTSELSVTPAEVYTGEEVTIGTLVTNVGSLAGSYKVGLKIDEVLLTFRMVTLEAGASDVANFTIAKDIAGTYAVTVDGLSETFVVSVPPEPPELINWWLVGGIIAACVAPVVIISLAAIRHRRKAQYTMPPSPES